VVSVSLVPLCPSRGRILPGLLPLIVPSTTGSWLVHSACPQRRPGRHEPPSSSDNRPGRWGWTQMLELVDLQGGGLTALFAKSDRRLALCASG
jgi:hypothetical protein